MADRNIKRPRGVNASDWNNLLNALDEIEKRPYVDEVEEVVATHRKEVGETDPLFAGSWGDNASATDLGSLLIVPEDEEENTEEAHLFASLLLSNQGQDEDGHDLPAAPNAQRNPLRVLAAILFPRRGDSGAAIALKSGILLTLVALLAALALLVNYLFLMPYANRQLNHQLYEMYDPENTMTVADTTQYPAGMLAAFKELYTRNNEVRGWLSFHSNGDSDIINLEYPVVQTDNNKDYMSLDFDKKENKNGTLFFDEKCRIAGAQDTGRVLVLYGNSTGNGQMLSGLTNLMGNVNNARSALTFTLSTLYEKADYYVMAVVLVDGDSKELDYKRTQFADEQDFFGYVQSFRDRSLFDYTTDLQDGDELAIIGTNLSKAASHLPDGRLLVLGRRQRPGETATNPIDVTKNEDVIMPFYWYINQGITPHDIYYHEGASTTTLSSESTTVTETGDTTQTEATADKDTTTDGDSTTDEDTSTDKDVASDEDTTTGKDATTDKESTTAATGADGSTTSVNKNTYTTSHTYTEEPTTTTSRSVPTGMVVTKVPLSDSSTEKTDTEDTTDETETTNTTETTKPQE